jgi:NADH-quinone oxidoreductase subunit L
MLISTLIVGAGIGAGWALYGRKSMRRSTDLDPLEKWHPQVFGWLGQRGLVDEFYARTVGYWNAAAGRACGWFDRYVWENSVFAITYLTLGLSWLTRWLDEYGINLGFDAGCKGVKRTGQGMSCWQTGQVQHYLQAIAVALAVLLLLLAWGGGS